MSIRKRITAVAMIVCLSFCIVNTDYKTAEASGLEALLPFVESAAGGLAGLSLGGLIAIVLSMTAVGYGTELAIDKWNDPASQFQAQIKSETNSVVSGWFNRLKDNFVSVKDGVTTLGDVIKQGLDYNIWDFVLPANKNVTIDLSADMQTYIKEFIEKYKGYEILEPGIKMNTAEKITNFFTQCGLADNDKSYLDYKYVTVLQLSGIQYFWILASNEEITLNVKELNTNYYGIYLNHGNIALWDYGYGSNKVQKQIYTKDSMTNILTGDRKKYDYNLNASNCNYIWLSNSNIKCTNSFMNTESVFPNGCIKQQIEPTKYKWSDNITSPKAQAITVNDYLNDELSGTDLSNIQNTDQVIEKVINADTKARVNKKSVVKSKIIGIDDTIPNTNTDDISTLNDTNDLIRSLPKSIADSIALPNALTDAFSPTADFPSLNNLGAKLGNFFDFTILYEYHEMIETFFTERINNNSPPVFKIYLKQSGFSYYKNLPDSITVINFDFMEKEIFTWDISIRYFIRSLLTFFVVGVWLNRTIKKLPGVVGGS